MTKRNEPLNWLKAHLDYEGEECLIWPFGVNISEGKRRGRVSFQGSRNFYAHRAMLYLKDGPPPSPQHETAHSCGNGHLACVNPKHLRWATQLENVSDRQAHGTTARGSRNARAKRTMRPKSC